MAIQRRCRWGILLILLGLTLVLGWWTRPSPVILSQYSTSLRDRTPEQRHNIVQAAQALDGTFIRPGEILSFNQVVGPRTRLRGYRSAPAFMTATTVTSVGGGICQVSSNLYNAALSAGLLIPERHAHYTPVASVPPGRDATVWYGQADLQVQNPYPWPIQVQAEISSERLSITLAGRKPLAAPPQIQIRQHSLDPQHLQVWVYRDEQLIAEDIYWRPPP